MNSSNRNIASFITSKNLRYTALLSVAALGVFSGAQALADTAAGTAEATVIKPIQIEKNVDLNFGIFAAAVLGGGGSLTVAPGSARTSTPGVIPVESSATMAAKFTVTGEESALYTITWPDNLDLVKDGDLGELMSLEFIGANTAASTETDPANTVNNGDLGAGGTQEIFLGGRLSVVEGQVSGTYRADLAVAVEYN